MGSNLGSMQERLSQNLKSQGRLSGSDDCDDKCRMRSCVGEEKSGRWRNSSGRENCVSGSYLANWRRKCFPYVECRCKWVREERTRDRQAAVIDHLGNQDFIPGALRKH